MERDVATSVEHDAVQSACFSDDGDFSDLDISIATAKSRALFDDDEDNV